MIDYQLTPSIAPPYRLIMTESQPTSFETSLKELERIVTELERGDLPLESQLKSFEKGVALSRECMKRLEEVEKRVETLVTGSDGKCAATPFEAAD